MAHFKTFKKWRKFTLCTLLSSISSLSVADITYQPDDFWFGPSISYNFGGGYNELSIGVEASYWHYTPSYYDRPIGVDIGYEYFFQRHRHNVYSEVEVSTVYTGAGVGLVWDSEYGSGLQGTLWANVFLGADVRLRMFWSQEQVRTAIGSYLKAPIGPKFIEQLSNESEDTSESK